MKVVRVDPSPMNTQQWLLTLDCGHELWVTRHGRPTTKNAKCEKCKDALLNKKRPR